MIPNFEEQKIHVHEEEASVTTVVRINLFSEGKIHELNRSHDESVAKSLVRIEKILSKSTTKSSSSKKDKNKTKRSHEISRESTSSTATLWKSGCLLNSEIILNKDLSEEILLSINNIHYSIERNPPNVESVVVFPTRQYFCNSPIVITAINKYPNDEIIYSWFLQDPSLNVGYTFIAEGCEFTPSIDHLGCKIKVYCTPARHVSSTHERRGRSVALYLHGTIQASLCDPSMVLVRQDFIAARIADEKSNQLRIVTYNILAETFATNTYAQKILYRYCPAKYLDTDYRMSLVQAELLAYEADVICLQECDYKVFNLYFRPLFQAREYSCHHTCKSSGNQEGCAIFISHKNLRVIQYVDVTLKDYLRAHTDLNKELFTTHPDVANILCEQLGNIVQIAVCERVGHPDQVVLIANTHLFYHKLASYVRLLQTNAIVEILSFIRNHVLIHGSDSVVDSFLAGAESTKCNHIDCHSSSSVSATATTTADSEGKRSDDVTIQTMSSLSLCPGVRSVATIFAGDLNSTPSSAATEYMTSGSISSSHSVWKGMDLFEWGKSTAALSSQAQCQTGLSSEHLENISARKAIDEIAPTLVNPFSWVSAAGYPSFTNYTADFKDLLDYVYVDSASLRPVRVAPFPTESVLCERVGLPAQGFPSDHLAVVVDVDFIVSSTNTCT